jgi:hypothetical protein
VARKTILLLTAAGAALAATACSSGPTTPDEFRVVRKAPLTVPPEYNLRPPAPGESRPQELSSDAAARVAVFGTDIGRDSTEGEKLLIKQAGADAVERTIRSEIDYDTSKVLRKNRSFSDAILNFGKSPAEGGVVDPAAEAERLAAVERAETELMGGKPIVIRKGGSGKLPGL